MLMTHFWWSNHLLTINGVLRLFLEVLRGLLVCVLTSSRLVIGVNVDHAFLTSAGEFLHCKMTSLPFKYFGLPIGANPSLESTWGAFGCSVEKKDSIRGSIDILAYGIELFSLIQCLMLFLFSSCPL